MAAPRVKTLSSPAQCKETKKKKVVSSCKISITDHKLNGKIFSDASFSYREGCFAAFRTLFILDNGRSASHRKIYKT